jgi:hypothetical protein
MFCALAVLMPPALAQQAAALNAESRAVQTKSVPAQVDYHGAKALLDRSMPAQALAELQQHASEHENEPDYFNFMGEVALLAGDYPVAVLSFERVVLMQPDNGGAWLDLAISTLHIGEFARAAAYFDYIESELHPPTILRQLIAKYRQQMTAAQKLRPWKLRAEATLGADSNANSGLQASSLPLTFETQRVDLPLDPNFRARHDQFVQLGGSVSYRQRLGDGNMDLLAGVRLRDYLHEHDFSTLSVNAGVTTMQPTRLGDLTGGLHVEQFMLGGQSLLKNARALLQVERPYRDCRIGAGGEIELRRYSKSSQLDGSLLWGQVGLACDQIVSRIPVQVAIIGRLGQDTPAADRPGGKTNHSELIGQLTAPLAWGAKVDFSHSIANSKDSSGYSPLLENNAVRNITRQNSRVLLTVPARDTWEYVVSLERTVVSSNLPLFQQSGNTITAGLRCSF